MKYVYKTVAALLAVAIIAMFIFTPLVSIRVESLAVQILSFIGQLKGNEEITDLIDENGELPTHIGESFSVYDIAYGDVNSIAGAIADIAKAYGDGDSKIMEQLDKVIAPVIAFVVLAVLAIICAVITAVFAFAAKNNRKVIYSALAGFGFSFMMPSTFKAVAQPFLDQEISIASLMDSMLGSLLGEVVGFQISSTFWFIPVAFMAIIVWTVLYNYTLPEAEKRERKLMLGEADE